MVSKRGGPVERTCDVKNCSETAVRSVSAKKASRSGLMIEGERGNVHLCKEHYKEFKRATKEDRKLERLGW